MIFVYQNLTEDKSYWEKVTFTVFDSYVIEGHEGNEVEVTCGPGETKWIRVVKQDFINPKYSWQSSFRVKNA